MVASGPHFVRSTCSLQLDLRSNWMGPSAHNFGSSCAFALGPHFVRSKCSLVTNLDLTSFGPNWDLCLDLDLTSFGPERVWPKGHTRRTHVWPMCGLKATQANTRVVLCVAIISALWLDFLMFWPFSSREYQPSLFEFHRNFNIKIF